MQWHDAKRQGSWGPPWWLAAAQNLFETGQIDSKLHTEKQIPGMPMEKTVKGSRAARYQNII